MAITAFSEETCPKVKNTRVLEPIVVTARGTVSRVSQTPGGLGVVTGDDIFEQQPISLGNAARRIPGVEKASDSVWASAINIRGLYINLGGGVELYGNPDLDPERSLFFEYGLHYNTPDIRFTAGAYVNYLKDLKAG